MIVQDADPIVRTGACESCGCPVESADKFCPACGTEQAVAAEFVEAEVVQKHFQCKNCGARTTVDPERRSYVCPFCDSTYVVEFDEAREKFREWLLGNSWFRPGDLKTARIADKLKGVYLPFWSFSMHASTATIGRNAQAGM